MRSNEGCKFYQHVQQDYAPLLPWVSACFVCC
jgi:hypothetical protein